MGGAIQLGDVFTVRSKRFNLWCTLQVMETAADACRVVALARMTAERPTARSLPPLEPFRSAYYYFAPHPALAICTLPPEELAALAEKVGNAMPLEISELPGGQRLVGTLADLVRELDRQHAWQTLPEADRASFVRTQRGDSHFGANREAVRHAEQNPLVYSLRLTAYDAAHLDLSATSVRELELNLAGVTRITLPKVCEELTLSGDLETLDRLQLHHPLEGDELKLTLSKLGAKSLPELGLPRLTSLRVTELDRLDLALLTRSYPKLATLNLWGRPGILENTGALAALSSLRDLLLVDLFGFAAHDFPAPEALPKLSSLILSSVPKDAAKSIAKRFGHVRYVDVTKLRGPDWMAQNLGNPFRSWEGRDNVRAVDAKAAFKAYVTAQKQLAKLTRGNFSEADIEAVLKAFVATLNQLAQKSALETQERDEAVRAFRTLLEGSAVSASTGDRWWEQWEDF